MGSVLFTLGALPILFYGLFHLYIAAVHPVLLAPVNQLLFYQLAEAILVLPGLFGSTTTVWEAYVGFNMTHSLSILAISLSTILVGNSRTLLGSPKVVLCLRCTAASLGIISIFCWFWLPVIATSLFLGWQLV